MAVFCGIIDVYICVVSSVHRCPGYCSFSRPGKVAAASRLRQRYGGNPAAQEMCTVTGSGTIDSKARDWAQRACKRGDGRPDGGATRRPPATHRAWDPGAKIRRRTRLQIMRSILDYSAD